MAYVILLLMRMSFLLFLVIVVFVLYIMLVVYVVSVTSASDRCDDFVVSTHSFVSVAFVGVVSNVVVDSCFCYVRYFC